MGVSESWVSVTWLVMGIMSGFTSHCRDGLGCGRDGRRWKVESGSLGRGGFIEDRRGDGSSESRGRGGHSEVRGRK